MKKVRTIAEIAKIAGVSVATVSRVINRNGYVSAETKKNVLDVIRNNNYVTNAIAKAMSTSKSGNIGLYVPTGVGNVFPNPYYDDMIRGITEKAWENDYRIILSYASTNNYYDMISQSIIDGIILVGPNIVHINDIMKLKSLDIPVLSTSRVIGIEELNYIAIDDENAIIQAIDYLYSLNHRKIAFICGPQHVGGFYDRMQGYKKGLEKYNIPYDDNIVFHDSVSVENGRRATYSILEQKDVTAIITSMDIFAIGVYMVLSEKHISIPEDISVLGFDNDKIAHGLVPSLTTVYHDGYTRGYLAAQEMCQLINQPKPNNTNTCIVKKVNAKLMIRESTALRRL